MVEPILYQVIDALAETIVQFQSKGLANAKSESEDLLCDLLNCNRSQLYQTLRLHIELVEYAKLCQWRERRLKGEPLAYISGKAHFYNCSLEINHDVLIPRQETELLVDKIISALKKEDHEGKVLWDVCCGSGCIGIALKKALPSLRVYLSDRSPEAVALAEKNAKTNQVAVNCLIGDLLTPFKGQKAHYVVSNPPYVSEEEYAKLDPEVKDFEPALALIGGKDGLDIYRRFAQELLVFLHPHAKVWFEIGYRQGDQVKRLFDRPSWKNRQVEKDWAGHDRFFFLENE